MPSTLQQLILAVVSGLAGLLITYGVLWTRLAKTNAALLRRLSATVAFAISWSWVLTVVAEKGTAVAIGLATIICVIAGASGE